MEPLSANLTLPLGGGVSCVEQGLAPHGNAPLVRGLQKVQAAQQGGLAAARGADDGQNLSLRQGEIDVLKHLGGAKALLNMLYV